jgi:molybdopterin converting factor small subunit
MYVTVKFQGIIADLLGRKSLQLELPDQATVADLERQVIDGDDSAAAILKQTRPFIDGQQAERTAPLHDGAEVIFMRPIAGGGR